MTYDCPERVYIDRNTSGSDAISIATLLNSVKNDPSQFLAMLSNGGGMNGMWNNPFFYLIFLALFGGNGLGGWNNNNGCNGCGFQQLSNQITDNHNADITNAAIKENAFALSGLTNGASSNTASIISAIKDCCCQTQQNILKSGYESQINNLQQTNAIQSGFDRTNTGLERGFSSIAFEGQKQTCDIINAGNNNTQRIIDTMNNHWNSDLQQRYNDARLELSQQRQNATLIEALRPAA